MANLPAQLERTLDQFSRTLPVSDLPHLTTKAIELRSDASAQALTAIQQLAVVGTIAPAGGYSSRAALDAFVTAAAGTVSATPTIAGLDFTGAELVALALDATTLTAPLAATGAIWTGVTFDGTDLTGATLTNGQFQRTKIGTAGLKLDGANLTGVDASDGFKRSSHSGAFTVTAANWTNALLNRTDLSGVTFSSTATAGNLTGASLRNANLRRSKFHDGATTPAHGTTLTATTVLDGADLRSADLATASTLTGVSMNHALTSVGTLWKAGFDPIAAKVHATR